MTNDRPTTYVATWNIPGCMPDEGAYCETDSLEAAWDYLSSERRDWELGAEYDADHCGACYVLSCEAPDPFGDYELGTVYVHTPGHCPNNPHDLGLAFTVTKGPID